LDTESGDLRTAKVPTTTHDQAFGLMNGIEALGLSPQGIDLITHGTTVATNATIERKGARCGLLTTRGFRDVLELRRRDRPKTYGLIGEFTPLIERRYRVEVDERIGADGEVIVELDEAGVTAQAEKLRDMGCEVLVICFMHSYANARHEERARELASEVWPNDYIVISSDVLPVMREFERTSTTVIAGYVRPLLERYLTSLTGKLGAAGYREDLLVVQSNGGLVAAPMVPQFAANTILSGPAAGVTAAVSIAKTAGLKNVVSCDMGGTSLDICVISDLIPAGTHQQHLDFGIPLCVPMIDVHAIGSGGGSIARIDATGILQVGPQSAGADPGPACFGKGGTRPTVTDAKLVLGMLGKSSAIGKSSGVGFDLDLARKAIGTVIAEPLGLSIEDAAEAILKVTGAQMGAYVRKKLFERGLDPRDFSILAFGGAGPLHANRIMRETGCERMVIPPYPGITSAMGCLLGSLRHDFIQSFNQALPTLDTQGLSDVYAEHIAKGTELLIHEGVPKDKITPVLGADMCYQGQTHSIYVEFDASMALSQTTLQRAFEEAYHRKYSQLLEGYDVLLVNLRTSLMGEPAVSDMSAYHRLPNTAPSSSDTCTVYFDGKPQTAVVYQRHSLPCDFEIVGPALLLQQDSTSFIEPGYRGVVQKCGSIFVERAA
jgi:N-methylhydantoinase A